jgi:D-alanyl-lipoteichoic acid acyltransferase DltB (MBOAT superfamily)
MAVGIALLFNIRLPQNFNAPYRSGNITEFWRRWHITLGRFLMSGVYIPLGGNRCGTFRTYMNLLITFFISGLWHGASWLFVFWGMVHGAALIVHRVWSKVLGWKMPAIPAELLTFFFVMLAWIPFRAENWRQVRQIYRGMFMPDSWVLPRFTGQEYTVFIISILLVIFAPTATEMGEKFRPTWLNGIFAAALMITAMFFFVKVSPFIYFNF